MDIVSYKEKLKRLEDQFKEDKDSLAKEYAYANAKHMAGDVITDHIGTIKVEKTKYTSRSCLIENPEVVYFGALLKKNGEPRKDGATHLMYQSEIKNID